TEEIIVQVGELFRRGPVGRLRGPGGGLDPQIHEWIDDEGALVVSPRLVELGLELSGDAMLGDIVPQLVAAPERQATERKPSFVTFPTACTPLPSPTTARITV